MPAWPGMGGERVVVGGRRGLVLPRRGEHAGEGDDRGEDQGDSRDDAAEAAGSESMRRQATGGFVTRRRPRRRSCVPRAADAAIIREADEAAPRAPVRWRHRATDPRPEIDLAIAIPILVLGVLEALAREHTDRWLVAAAVNGVAVALRRRQPLGALAAVVIVQALAHDQTYDTDPLSPFLAELILMFTVAYELRLKPRWSATASASPT